MTIDGMWKEFEKIAVPPLANEHQRDTMRRIFYAGFMVAFSTVTNISTEMSEDSACAKLSELHTELSQFTDNEIFLQEVVKNGVVN
jgi:hypothetical protein